MTEVSHRAELPVGAAAGPHRADSDTSLTTEGLSTDRPLSIGEVCDRLGISARTARCRERIGLMELTRDIDLADEGGSTTSERRDHS